MNTIENKLIEQLKNEIDMDGWLNKDEQEMLKWKADEIGRIIEEIQKARGKKD